ncbi:MAG TPA: MraY family glycosyltransferase [Actinomycetota bacterium]|nr:MraY family glycosyltransferase [Actinomycetota bacterium]
MIAYLLVGLIAGVVTFTVTPLVSRFSARIGAIDHPNDRKVHAHPTPTLGGLAIFVGVLAAGGAAILMPEFDGVFLQSGQPLGIAAGAAIILGLGVIDDFRPLTAAPKLAGQVFAAGLLFLAGVKMQFVLLPETVYVLSDDLSVLVTVIWIVAMINAVNLIDGLDGLAAGITAIAAASFFVYTYNLNELGNLGLDAAAAPLLAIIIMGAALGFLRHNFHPARIFMGDSGSMLLGLVLGATTIVGVGRAPTLSTDPANVLLAYSALWIPAMVVAIPILDAVLAIVRRVRGRRNVFHADKEHLHHRLMDLGHGHKQAVVVMYVWSALAAGAGLAFTFLDRSLWVFVLPIAVGAIVLYTLFPVLTKALEDHLGS